MTTVADYIRSIRESHRITRTAARAVFPTTGAAGQAKLRAILQPLEDAQTELAEVAKILGIKLEDAK